MSPVARALLRTLLLGGLAAVATDASAEDATPLAATVRWIRHPSRRFAISATEVTVAQFRACVGAGACDAAAASALCNYGMTGRDDHPVNCVAYQGAEQYCAHAGGRVCTEEEWLDACRGTDGRAFPYAATFDLARCNVHSLTTPGNGGSERTTVPVGSYPGCEGGLSGLFDMAGNVAEWVSNCHDDYCKFRGAGYLSNDPIDTFAGCSGVCSGNNKSFQSGVVGIRCCKDETP